MRGPSRRAAPPRGPAADDADARRIAALERRLSEEQGRPPEHPATPPPAPAPPEDPAGVRILNPTRFEAGAQGWEEVPVLLGDLRRFSVSAEAQRLESPLQRRYRIEASVTNRTRHDWGTVAFAAEALDRHGKVCGTITLPMPTGLKKDERGVASGAGVYTGELHRVRVRLLSATLAAGPLAVTYSVVDGHGIQVSAVQAEVDRQGVTSVSIELSRGVRPQGLRRRWWANVEVKLLDGDGQMIRTFTSHLQDSGGPPWQLHEQFHAGQRVLQSVEIRCADVQHW